MKNAPAGFERLGALMAVRYGKPELPRRCRAPPRSCRLTSAVLMTTSRKPAGREPLEVIFDEPLATHAQQWFGLRVGQRAHAFAASRGEHHGLHLCLRRATPAFAGRARASLRLRAACARCGALAFRDARTCACVARFADLALRARLRASRRLALRLTCALRACASCGLRLARLGFGLRLRAWLAACAAARARAVRACLRAHWRAASSGATRHASQRPNSTSSG